MDHGSVDFPQIWPRLTPLSRSWLIEHNGEPLPDDLIGEVLGVAGGETNAEWWAGPSVDGQTQLNDEVVDWIETVANGDVT